MNTDQGRDRKDDSNTRTVGGPAEEIPVDVKIQYASLTQHRLLARAKKEGKTPISWALELKKAFVGLADTTLLKYFRHDNKCRTGTIQWLHVGTPRLFLEEIERDTEPVQYVQLQRTYSKLQQLDFKGQFRGGNLLRGRRLTSYR